MALSRLHASNAAAQTQIGEQSDMIAHLSGRLQASNENVEREQRQIEWLQQVNSVLTGYPDWWAFMPKGWRQKKIEKRLKRKGLFDTDAYLARYPDIVSSDMSPVKHYILHGMKEGRDFQSID